MPGQDLTSKDISVFTQPGGAAPANALKLAGLDGQHLAIGGLTLAVADIKPDFGYDPLNPGQYEVRASLTSAPGDFDTLEITAGELSGKVPSALVRDNVPFNLYMNAGTCVDPTNPLAFNAYVQIAANCQISGIDGGDRKMRAEDAVLMDKLSVKAIGGIYPVGPLIFGEQQPSAVAAALTFGNRVSNLCGVAGVETKDIYVGIAAAGATVGKLRYSVDGGGSWADLAITGIVNTEVIKAVCVLGQQLIVVTDTAGSATQSGYYVTDIDQDTGVPGSTWTKVTAGIAATDLVTDAWVERGALYIVAAKGWIYKTQTPLTGVTTVRSDIYFLPLRSPKFIDSNGWITYYEYLDYEQNLGSVQNILGDFPRSRFAITPGGQYLIYETVQDGLCIQWGAVTEHRLICKAPFLAARFTGIRYTDGVPQRSGIPGDANYAAGGVTTYAAPTYQTPI